MSPVDPDIVFMSRALALADQAASMGEVPVGCVIVGHAGQILSEGFNERETAADPTAHAEILAIRRAAAILGHWRLVGATLYVTLEPCAMCAGAMVNARVERVVWGADDPKAGAMRSFYGVGLDGKLNHTLKWTAGVEGHRCAEVLRSFFAALRACRTSR